MAILCRTLVLTIALSLAESGFATQSFRQDRPREEAASLEVASRSTPQWVPHSEATCDLAGVLTCGEVESGRLESGDCVATNGSAFDFYSFYGEEGDPIRAEVFAASSTLEVLVTLHDGADGELFAQGQGKGQAALTHSLPYDGEFILAVAAVRAGASGDYQLKLSCLNDSPSLPCNWSGTVACGFSTNAVLTSSDCPAGDSYDDYYKLPLKEGDTVEVKVVAGFALYVELYLENPEDVYAGAYRAGKRDETLVFTADRAGTYGLQVGTVERLVGGAYSLQVNCLPPPPCGKRRSVRH